MDWDNFLIFITYGKFADNHFPLMLWHKMQMEGSKWFSTKEAVKQALIVLMYCAVNWETKSF